MSYELIVTIIDSETDAEIRPPSWDTPVLVAEGYQDAVDYGEAIRAAFLRFGAANDLLTEADDGISDYDALVSDPGTADESGMEDDPVGVPV